MAAVEQLWGDFPDLGAALAGDWALVQRGAGGGRIDMGQFVRNGDMREIGIGGAGVAGHALSLAHASDARLGLAVAGVLVGHVRGLTDAVRVQANGTRSVELWAGGNPRLTVAYNGPVTTSGPLTIGGNLDIPAGSGLRIASRVVLVDAANGTWLYGGTAGYTFRNSANTATILTLSDAGVVSASGNIQPVADNVRSLGVSGTRWSVVYAATGAINTSDVREKQDVRPIDDALLDAWGDVDAVLFRWKDAVAAKGEDARIHPGYIAQQVEAALAAHGIDGFAYGLLCYDEWPEEREPIYETRIRDVLGPVQVDTGLFNADGSPAFRTEEVVIGQEEYQHDTGETRVTLEAGNRYGLRYSECQVVESAYLRRRIGRLEARLASMEAAQADILACLGALEDAA